ncbi:ABC transporter ATP-binding protein [Roseobacter sp. HKCCA0434]|uniref:ABC transporter ATP-binding protein n=1 Tax=Roseobacter sp. HKCCA0434 TaxID=3079297 RepID=UPI002905E145|nr:ABC transporter ATP-binding protein [Roseobacter sp. HKCCA0434]
MTGLAVSGVSHAYGPKPALTDVSFDLARGGFCALLGPNGAGKSTLFALLTRLIVADAGHIAVAGHDMARAPLAALARLGVVFQQPTLDLDLTVRQNLRYFAALHGLSGTEREQRIDAALDRLAMRERAGEKARALNGGHRRRTEIARALLHQPDVMLLDEPTVGLDAESRAAIAGHLHDLADEGETVLWATHLADEVRDSDRLVILHHGRVLVDGIAGEVRGDQPLTRAFLQMVAS